MKHLLVIRNSAMGDVALALPAVRSALETYPELKITFVSHRSYSPFFEGITRLTFFPVDFKSEFRGIPGIIRLAQKIMKAGPYDAVLDLHSVIRSWIITAYFKAKGTAVIVIDKDRNGKKAITRKHFKIFKRLTPTYERYCKVFEKAGFPIKLAVGPWIKAREFPDTFFKENSLYPKDKTWVGFAP